MSYAATQNRPPFDAGRIARGEGEAKGKLCSAGEAGAAARSPGSRMKAVDGTWTARARSTWQAECRRDSSSVLQIATLAEHCDKEAKKEARFYRLTPELRGP